MSKILLAACIFACTPILAHADIFSSYSTRADLVAMATKPDDTLAKERVFARLVKDQFAPARVFKSWANYDNQSVIGVKWGEVGLNLLRWSDETASAEWQTAARTQDVPQIIYQQNNLIDLERVLYSSAGYEKINIDSYTVANTKVPLRELPKTSEVLMKEGYPPVGPDNKHVAVCRIGLSSMAPYVELSESQRLKFSKLIELEFSQCLTGYRATIYWKTRHSDFVNKYHDRVKPY
jgi:hypothetical protein